MPLLMLCNHFIDGDSNNFQQLVPHQPHHHFLHLLLPLLNLFFHFHLQNTDTCYYYCYIMSGSLDMQEDCFNTLIQYSYLIGVILLQGHRWFAGALHFYQFVHFVIYFIIIVKIGSTMSSFEFDASKRQCHRGTASMNVVPKYHQLRSLQNFFEIVEASSRFHFHHLLLTLKENYSFDEYFKLFNQLLNVSLMPASHRQRCLIYY